MDEERSRNNPGYGEYNYINSMANLSRRFLAMGYPAEAYIAFTKAYGDEEKVASAKQWGGNFGRSKDRLLEDIQKGTTPEATLSILSAALEPSTPDAQNGDAKEPQDEQFDAAVKADVALFLIEPQVQRNSLVDSRVTILLEDFTARIAEDESLQKAVATWLREHPAKKDASLKSLVSRLLLCDTVDEVDMVESTARRIASWTAKPAKDIATSSEDKEQGEDTASTVEALPEELLLGMAALRMPEGPEWQADTVKMLERAATVAEANELPALTSSLKCEIAARIAREKPAEAREILLRALDEILPAANAEPAEEGDKS